MASARYWGDEKHTDAVYAVYLRKVRYVPPNNFEGIALESLDYLLSPGRHQVSEVTQMDAPDIAGQLTYWDAELFKKLLPYQCQGCFWSKRHRSRKSSEQVYTVKATVEQFNALSRRVMTSVVYPDCKPLTRAKRISRWIEVAKELRILKNFSSLKAVLSGLQSEPVHRLKHSWSFVPNYRRSLEIEVPMTSTPEPAKRGQMRKTTTLQKLFGGTTSGEDTPPTPTIKGALEQQDWFSVVPLSLSAPGGGRNSLPRSQTAPSTPSSVASGGVSVGKSVFYPGGSEFSPGEFFVGGSRLSGGRKPRSISRNSSSNSSGRPFTPCGPLKGGKNHLLVEGHVAPVLKSSVSTDSRNSRNSLLKKNSSVRNRTSSYTAGIDTKMVVKALERERNSYILRVKLDDSLQSDSADGAMYKCIRLENGDKMAVLIEKALQKHLISVGAVQDYCLVQILEDGREFLLPEKCNPFYAVVAGDNTTTALEKREKMLNFILKRKENCVSLSNDGSPITAFMKKKKRKRSNLLRWSSGFL